MLEGILDLLIISFSYSFVIIACKSINIDEIGIIELGNSLSSICKDDKLN